MNTKLFKFRPFEVVKENFAKGSIVPGPRSGEKDFIRNIEILIKNAVFDQDIEFAVMTAISTCLVVTTFRKTTTHTSFTRKF